MPTYDKKTKTWRANVRICGKLLRKRGFLNKQLAQLWEKDQILKYQQDLVGLSYREDIEIKVVIDEYLKHAEEYKAPNSVKRDEASLKQWRKYFSIRAFSRVFEIPEDCVYNFLQWRKNTITSRWRPPSTRTLNIDMGTIRKCFVWAVERGLIKHNPFQGKMPLYKQKRKGLPRYLTLEEIKIIEDNALAMIKRNSKLASFFPAFFVLVRTGVRSDELCSMDISNIDFDRKQIILRPDQTKSDYQRVIPIKDNVVELLGSLADQAQKNGRNYLFATSTGKRQTNVNLLKRFRNILTRLETQGLMENTKEIHIHTLRRTYISHLIMAGVDPIKVMAIVGHQDWATIKRYLVLSPQYVAGDRDGLPY